MFGAIVERLLSNGFPLENIITFPPTTVKKFAREFLPEDEQFEVSIVKGKEKKKLVKMDKKMIVKAVTSVVDKKYWGHLKMSGKNGGLDDFCDSWIILQMAKQKLGDI